METKQHKAEVKAQTEDNLQLIRSALERYELTRTAVADLTDEQLRALLPQIVSVGKITRNRGNVAIGRNIVQVAQVITSFKEQSELEKLAVLRQNLRDAHKNRWLPASADERLVIGGLQNKIRWQRKKLERMNVVVPDDSIDSYSPPLMRSYIIGALFILALLAGGLGYYFYEQAQPPTKVIILVANFDGPDPEKYRVSETVLERLGAAMKPYSDVEVISLGKAITQQEGSAAARADGEGRKAAIVIWGWYGVTPEAVQLSVNFEVLRSPTEYVELGPDAHGKPRTIEIAKLESFSMQTDLSAEMVYLSLFTVGMSRYSVGDWDGAIARFTGALGQTAEPVGALDQSVVYAGRGFAYSSKREYDKAIGDFDQVIKFSPDYAEAYRNRASAYLWKSDYDKAIADYGSAIRLKPNDAAGYEDRGVAYLDKLDFDNAIADDQRVIDLKPRDISGYLNQGVDYLVRGERNYSPTDYDKAIADFNFVIQLSPNDISGYSDRGNAYSDKGDYNQALADYNHVLDMVKPDTDDAHFAYYSRGKTYYSMGNYNQAISDFNLANEIRSGNPGLYVDRGLAYDAIGNYDQAISDINHAMIILPDQPEEYLNRSLAYYDKGNYDQAIADCNKAIELGETSGHAYWGLGKAYAKKGNYDNAIADYNKALKLALNNPENYQMYYDLGSAYFHQGEYGQAVTSLDQAIKLKPNYLVAYVQRGEVYYYAKSYDLAISNYTQAIKLEPDAEIYLFRSLAYKGAGRVKEAVYDLFTVLFLTKDQAVRQRAENQLRELGVSVSTPTPLP